MNKILIKTEEGDAHEFQVPCFPPVRVSSPTVYPSDLALQAAGTCPGQSVAELWFLMSDFSPIL